MIDCLFRILKDQPIQVYPIGNVIEIQVINFEVVKAANDREIEG